MIEDELMSPIEQAAVASTRGKVRKQLQQGVESFEVRRQTEERLSRRLADLAEDAPSRPGVLRAHALHQRAVEETIREWETER